MSLVRMKARLLLYEAFSARQVLRWSPIKCALACSPYCWATRLAVIHKGLKFKTVPWHFGEQDKIKFSKQGLV